MSTATKVAVVAAVLEVVAVMSTVVSRVEATEAAAVMSMVVSRVEVMEAVEAGSEKKAEKAIISIIVGRKRRDMVVGWVVEEEEETSMVGKGVWVVVWAAEMIMVDKEEVWEEAWEDKTTTTPKAAPATVVNAVTSNQNSAVEQPEDTATKALDASLAQAVTAKDTQVLKPPTAATMANLAVPWLTLNCTLAAPVIPPCSRTPWDICRTTTSRMVGRALMKVPLSMRIRPCMVANKRKAVGTIAARLSVRARRCKH